MQLLELRALGLRLLVQLGLSLGSFFHLSLDLLKLCHLISVLLNHIIGLGRRA